jgi:pimeloyl-ACP methyl ester carboxylesterase
MKLFTGTTAVAAAWLAGAAPLAATPQDAATDPPALPATAPEMRAYGIAVAPGETLHVEATGTGSPVVIVPGLLGSAFGFRKVIEPIAEAGHRVIVVEPLGVGASARPRHADYSLEAQARRVGAVLDTLHVADATFVAHAVGGSVVFRLAAERPALVRDIVSIEGGVAESAGTPGLRHALSLASFLGHFGLEGLVIGKMEGKFRDSSGDPSWITDGVMNGYVASLRNDYQDVIAAYKAMASAPESAALAPRLARVRCPVELLVGGAPHDGGVGQNEIGVMRARLPAFTVVTVPGAGHWIQEERPQALIAAVERAAR